MSEIEEKIPDLKYRILMLELSHQFTSKDKEELQYVLTALIPPGKMESLDTMLKVFQCLEQLEFVGPDKLCVLKTLFSLMGKHELSEMVGHFIEKNWPNG
jgi:hypothetical protein